MNKTISNESFCNDYCGFTVKGSNTSLNKVDRVSIESLNSQSFWDQYVHTRRPVVICGFPSSFSGMEKWSNDYLAEVCGNEDVEIECRGNTDDSFGQGQKCLTKMKFSKFISLLETGCGLHYLTSQKIENGKYNWPALMTTPALQLYQKNDFSSRVSLFGNLVPSAINIWMGCSAVESRSGLHHDYHDNLYLLVRGRKHFRLYSPADAEYMYTHGSLSYVHPNGLINYDGFPTGADGLDHNTKQIIRVNCAKVDAEKELYEAEKAEAKGELGARERREKAEKHLDDILDQVLALQSWSDTDDYDEGEEEEEEEEEENISIGFSSTSRSHIKRQRTENKSENNISSTSTIHCKTKNDQKRSGLPLNFSRITDPSNPNLEQFPMFRYATPLMCEIHAGEMLYLPAGWFHEVTSFSSQSKEMHSKQPSNQQENSKENLSSICHGKDGHLALNYWVHPPDGDYQSPYTNKIWNRFWSIRNTEVNNGCRFDEDNDATSW